MADGMHSLGAHAASTVLAIVNARILPYCSVSDGCRGPVLPTCLRTVKRPILAGRPTAPKPLARTVSQSIGLSNAHGTVSLVFGNI